MVHVCIRARSVKCCDVKKAAVLRCGYNVAVQHEKGLKLELRVHVTEPCVWLGYVYIRNSDTLHGFLTS